jgi:hypothetical protein
MIVALHDAKKPEKERIAILQSLRKVRTDAVKEGLKPLLTPTTSTALAVATIRAAADLGGDDFIAPLLAVAQASGLQSGPQARGLLYNAALEALSTRTTWTQAMLNAIAEGKVSPSGFPRSRAARPWPRARTKPSAILPSRSSVPGRIHPTM